MIGATDGVSLGKGTALAPGSGVLLGNGVKDGRGVEVAGKTYSPPINGPINVTVGPAGASEGVVVGRSVGAGVADTGGAITGTCVSVALSCVGVTRTGIGVGCAQAAKTNRTIIRNMVNGYFFVMLRILP